MTKLMSAVRNSPTDTPPGLKDEKSGLPPILPMRSRMITTNASTTLANAVPMTTATARSTTLPRIRKSLKPLIMSVPSCAPGGGACGAAGVGWGVDPPPRVVPVSAEPGARVRPVCGAATRVTRVTDTPGVPSLLRGPRPVPDGDDETLPGLESTEATRHLGGLRGVEREGHSRRCPGAEPGRLLGVVHGEDDDVGRGPGPGAGRVEVDVVARPDADRGGVEDWHADRDPVSGLPREQVGAQQALGRHDVVHRQWRGDDTAHCSLDPREGQPRP